MKELTPADLRDYIIRAHGMATANYVQTDSEMRHRIGALLAKAISEDAVMTNFLSGSGIAGKSLESKARFELKESIHQDQAGTGRRYIQIEPVLKPDCCAQGELRFAVWQVWEDEPETHADAKAKAIASAKSVLAEYAS